MRILQKKLSRFVYLSKLRRNYQEYPFFLKMVTGAVEIKTKEKKLEKELVLFSTEIENKRDDDTVKTIKVFKLHLYYEI